MLLPGVPASQGAYSQSQFRDAAPDHQVVSGSLRVALFVVPTVTVVVPAVSSRCSSSQQSWQFSFCRFSRLSFVFQVFAGLFKPVVSPRSIQGGGMANSLLWFSGDQEKEQGQDFLRASCREVDSDEARVRQCSCTSIRQLPSVGKCGR